MTVKYIYQGQVVMCEPCALDLDAGMSLSEYVVKYNLVRKFSPAPCSNCC